ncbi:MAG: tetratricopeptide repeat protein, partial [Candidatus Cloacimonadaceae bacterium]|nr:tetratricopeptide repeat protein [Candidatus Cloacimonadaceae bacterium]
MLTDKEDECTSYNSLGLLYWEQQDYPNARLYFRKAIALIDAKISARLAAGVYNNLGNVLLKTGETAAAGEAYIASLRIKESYGSTAELATANLNLGNMFFTTTDFPRALQFFQTALSLYQSTGDERNKGLVLANLGSTYNHLNDENRALKHHREALVIFQKFNMLENIGKTLNNIANTHTRQQRHDEALESYAKALALKKASNDTEGIATTLSNIGKAHIASEAWDEALASIKASNEYAQKIDAQLIILNNYKQLAKIYEAMGDYKKACEAYKMFIEKDLEIYEIAKKDVIAEMIVRFDTETKEREISELQTLQQAQQEKLQRQQWEQRIILFITLGVLLTALGLGLLYRAKQKEVQRRRSIQAELEDLNRELEDRIQKAIENYQRDQEIIARKSKLESLGTLSAGIAHEINQPLSAISMSIENIQHRMLLGSLNPEYLKGKCSKNMEDIERIRQIIQHVRLFSRDQKNGLIEQVDVNLVVKNAMELSMHDIRKNRIQPLLDLSEQTPMIVGNHFKLEQVLLNLISNAQDAILQKAQMASEPLDAYI